MRGLPLRLLRLAARPSSSIPTADSARPARLGADRLLAVLAVGQAAHPTAGHGALTTASMKSQVHIGETPPLILLLAGAGEHLRELLGQERLVAARAGRAWWGAGPPPPRGPGGGPRAARSL